jgi:ankyrin repeat protein
MAKLLFIWLQFIKYWIFRVFLQVKFYFEVSAMGDRSPVMGILLEAGADPNLQDQNGDTCLHLAARSNNRSTAEILITFGAEK